MLKRFELREGEVKMGETRCRYEYNNRDIKDKDPNAVLRSRNN